MKRVFLVGKDDPRATQEGFLNAAEALRFLQRAALEHDNLRHFREVWRVEQKGGGSQPPTDRSVLQFLAERLASGGLRRAGQVRAEPTPAKKGPGGSGGAPKPPAPPPPPGKPNEPPLKLRPPPVAPPQAPKVDPVMDLAEQADCLVSAAKDGLPFVEQCAKP